MYLSLSLSLCVCVCECCMCMYIVVPTCVIHLLKNGSPMTQRVEDTKDEQRQRPLMDLVIQWVE